MLDNFPELLVCLLALGLAAVGCQGDGGTDGIETGDDDDDNDNDDNDDNDDDNDDEDDDDDTGSDSDSDSDADSDSDGDSDSDSDSDSDADSDTDTDADNIAPSVNPPGGLSVDEVPMFVTVGFDDNAYSGLDGSAGEGGMTWATDTLRDRENKDGTPARVTFFLTTTNIETWQSETPTLVKRAWHTALEDGHEVGDHSHTHPHGQEFTEEQWKEEIESCIEWLTKPFGADEPDMSPDNSLGIGAETNEIRGFRTPYLEYGDATLSAVQAAGLTFDCSIEEGFEPEQDGTDYYWPYSLDNGSPGHEILVEWELKDPITNHPGLFEMPVYAVIVPPDDKCAEYGVPEGLRAKMKGYNDWFDEESGKITGFDYNLWVLFKMTKAEFLATLKYTLDLRLEGNRAPFMLGAHTDYYSTKYTAPENATLEERQQAMEEFLDYALGKDVVRIVPIRDILHWVRNPKPL